jgi:serine/threonine protein kinase
MLAGDLPFKGATVSDVIAKQIQEPPLPLTAYRDDLPAGIDRVLLRALAKNPDMRYQDAKDFAQELNELTHPTLSAEEEVTLVRSEPVYDEESDADSIFVKPEPNVWKTAFIALAGIVVLSSFFIYFTRVRQIDLPSQLPTDANGQPVQPVNPASGTAEDSLANMSGYTPGGGTNSNSINYPGAANDPWSRRGFPPAGAQNYGVPYQVQPGGPVITIQNSNSPFMPQEYQMYPPNSNVKPSPSVSPKQTPSPKTSPQTSPTPAATPTPAGPVVETNTQKPVPVERPREVTPKPTPSIVKPISPSKEDKNG